MPDPTILLMTAPRGYDELGDDERILIGGMQDRGFHVERLETRALRVLSTVVPTANTEDELTAVRKQLREARWRLNWSTGVVAFFGSADALTLMHQHQYAAAFTYLLLILAALLIRFVILPRDTEVR